MDEFNLYKLIFSSKYLSENQEILEEAKNNQRARVNNLGLNYVVYRFDLDINDFLPFFNNTHNSEEQLVQNPTPRGLRMFCDYILLVSHHEKTFVVLVEMKNGKNPRKAAQQLGASELFMDYIKKSALRIKDMCGFDSFDTKNIVLKKVVLKPSPPLRKTTQPGKDNSINWDVSPVVLRSNELPLRKICK